MHNFYVCHIQCFLLVFVKPDKRYACINHILTTECSIPKVGREGMRQLTLSIGLINLDFTDYRKFTIVLSEASILGNLKSVGE